MTTNQHGEQVTVIGTVADGQGGRTEIRVEEFRVGPFRYFALVGTSGGHPDARRFETQVKRAKAIYADPSNQAEWSC